MSECVSVSLCVCVVRRAYMGACVCACVRMCVEHVRYKKCIQIPFKYHWFLNSI